MSFDDLPTRDRLIQAAAELFRQKGYHGVGLTELLQKAGAPKGSLYHHFPNGKPDLAVAAAEWASAGMMQIIDDAFAKADCYEDGATTLCHKLAKLFDLSKNWNGCPISMILFDSPSNDIFRQRADSIFHHWTTSIATHATRLGKSGSDATELAETLLIGIEGSWIMARARRNSEILRELPRRVLNR